MSLAIVYTRAQVGIDAPLVSVEVHLSGGLPGLFIVGLPEAAVKESKDRVRGAILNSQFEFPSRRITINLAPADLPKEGGRFDLPIALGILAASGQINRERLGQYEFLGELALGGEVRGIRGVLPATLACRAAGRILLVPGDNAAEALLVGGVKVLGAVHLLEVCRQLATGVALQPPVPQPRPPLATLLERDLSDVRGQQHAKRALEIAAAGGHNLLLIGPPGTGKTMLASRLPGIMPPLTEAEALETAAIASISAQGLDLKQWGVRPFRAPHHTASGVALVGGGGQPRPGEISLAHHGVLFLDELPEYDRRVLEVLREPLESGRITISRAARQADFPARFQLVAAMNPCPCGYLGDAERRCACGQEQVRRYRARVSGPLIDRIDLHIEVPRLAHRVLRGDVVEESSATVRARVCVARDRQLQRAGKPNSALGVREIERYCTLSENDHRLLEQALERLGLSPRAYHRILKVARTIADLAGSDSIKTPHLTEAISYRALDRSLAH
ncbi:MAG: YifB family Mg chelatase-like AAA ATPase [Candidatus Contendobacter sp.]